MKRRNFLRLVSVAIAATVVAPKLLTPKEPVRWIDKKEWDFHKNFYVISDPCIKTDRKFILHVTKEGIEMFDTMFKEEAKQYLNKSLC